MCVDVGTEREKYFLHWVLDCENFVAVFLGCLARLDNSNYIRTFHMTKQYRWFLWPDLTQLLHFESGKCGFPRNSHFSRGFGIFFIKDFLPCAAPLGSFRNWQ